MGFIFNPFQSSRSLRIKNSESLRKALIETIEKNDAKRLYLLCKHNYAWIIGSFHNWLIVPVNIRSDPHLEDRYNKFLLIISEMFERQFSDRALIKLLMGTANTNPIIGWQNAVTHAQALIANAQIFRCGNYF